MVYSSSGKVLSWVLHHRKDAILGITSQNKVRKSAAGRQAEKLCEQSCAGDHHSTNRNRFANICSHHLRAAAAAKSLQSCLTLCDPIDGSPPGSADPGNLQARTLEWVAISFCNAWKWKVKVKSLSHVWLFTTPRTAAYQAPLSMGVSRQEYWSGLPFPSPMHESEKWMWSCSVVSDSSRPHGLQPTRLLRPWEFPGKNTGVRLPLPSPIWGLFLLFW